MMLLLHHSLKMLWVDFPEIKFLYKMQMAEDWSHKFNNDTSLNWTLQQAVLIYTNIYGHVRQFKHLSLN